ncbi:MAG: peptidylprolyl isomerase [Bacteroidetes bacterium]|nr:MAG: peptidylprolyl isomerase [Bacteroidota bacterium]
MINIKEKIISLLILITLSASVFSQTKVVDQIIGVVGKNIILESDIENQRLQLQSQGYYSSGDIKCEIFEDMLFQKLLVNQAAIDSIEVSENEVKGELDRRIQYFIAQIGSQKKLEEFYGKSLLQIKDEFSKVIKEQLITQKMRQEITKDLKITPSEVRTFFKKLSKDSLPYIKSEVEIQQICKYPKVEDIEILRVKERLRNFKERINNGKSFATLAVLYSEDPGSAKKGGELGFVGRGDLVPEFAAVAFNLKEGEVSKIVKTDYGYHIIQLIEKKGERINVRHILLKPKVSTQEKLCAKQFLDSVKNLINIDTISFKDAVLKYSDDKETRFNSGIVVNPQTNASAFELEQLDPDVSYAIKNLKVGEMSEPFESVDANGKLVYKIVKLKSKTEGHIANMNDDYQKIQDAALEEKKQDFIDSWIEKKQKTTFIKVDDSYKNCKFNHKGWVK